jgi:hypothetical protein
MHKRSNGAMEYWEGTAPPIPGLNTATRHPSNSSLS